MLSSKEGKRFFIISKQSPSTHQILLATPYTSALCLAHLRTSGSFSKANILSQRPLLAKAMALPPAPAKASIMAVLLAGAALATCSAILLQQPFSYFGQSDTAALLPCNRLGCDAEPCIIGHPDAFVVLIPDVVALVPIPANR